MRLNLTDKAKRLLEFLFVVQNNPRIFAALQTRGFDRAAIQEGWQLLIRSAGSTAGLGTKTGYLTDTRLIDRLDEWENEWFPIIEAVLKRRHPTHHAEVFAGLSQTEGPAVVVSVGQLVERVVALPEDVRQTLTNHGATAEVLGTARAMLDQVQGPDPVTPTVPMPDDTTLAKTEEERKKAEDDMWGFYLMWSAIARSRVKDKRLLRSLGFSTTTKRTAASGDPGTDAEPANEPPVA